MNESFRRALGEIADQLGGRIRPESAEMEIVSDASSDFDDFLTRKGVSVVGTSRGRSASVEFRADGVFEIDLLSSDRLLLRIEPSSFWARLNPFYGRRLATGDNELDAELLVKDEGGADPGSIVTEPAFASALRALRPFHEVHAKDRILQGVFPCDLERVSAAEVLGRVEGLADLAEQLETASL